MEKYYALFENTDSKDVGALFMGDDFLKDKKGEVNLAEKRERLLGVWKALIRAQYSLGNKLCAVKSSQGGVDFKYAGRNFHLSRSDRFGIYAVCLMEKLEDESGYQILFRSARSSHMLTNLYVRNEADAVFLLQNLAGILSAVGCSKDGEPPSDLMSTVPPEDEGDWLIDISYTNDANPLGGKKED
jgi:hypothetical protein